MWPLIAGMAKPITLSHQVRSGGWESIISANGGLPAHRYTPQVTRRWPRGSESASPPFSERCIRSEVIEERTGGPQWAPTPPPPCPKDTWRPHIRRRRPPCPKGGVRTLIISALRHIRSPPHLPHGPRGSKIEKTSSTCLNTYTTMKYICGDRVKGVYGQSRPKNLRIIALIRLPGTETNINVRGDPLRCFSSHQMDQHVLDIQRNVLFLWIIHPDRGIPRHKTARGLPQISGCGKFLPTDLI